MEYRYNPFQHQDQTNSEDLQCMPKNSHTWTILYFFCIQVKKKNDGPTDPPNFQAKRTNKPFIFLGLMMYKTPYIVQSWS